MFGAVHSDRSGRVVLAADRAAAVSDGAIARPLAQAIALPDDAEIVSLPERAAIGLDRSGRPHPLGVGRFATAAVLPPGYVRTGLPAYEAEPRSPALAPRAYAAVAAEETGALVVSAAAIDAPAATAPRDETRIAESVTRALRDRPANRVIRQLARCAREYRCRAAANAIAGTADAAIPIGAPANEHSADGVLVNARPDASPTESAAFRPDADEIADVAGDHLARGGPMVAFGRACEGEPLLAARVVAPAVAAIRGRTRRGTIHVETNGSATHAVARLAEAGVGSFAFRMASARADTYERVHRPSGYRFSDVRASIGQAVAAKVEVALVVLVMPGVTDTEAEVRALVALAGEVPEGGALLLRDLAADPERARGIAGIAEPPLGILAALERLRSEAPHLRLGTIARPLSEV